MKHQWIMAVALGCGAPTFAELPLENLPDATGPFAAESTVSTQQLGAITGRSDVNMLVNANNSSEVSHNLIVGDSVTGTISFDGGSFQNLNGLSVLSANTGNNVAINSSLNVNVAVRP